MWLRRPDTAGVADELGYKDDRLLFRHAIARTGGVIVGVSIAMAASQWLVKGVMVLAGEDVKSSVAHRVAETWPVMADTWQQGFRLTMSKRAGIYLLSGLSESVISGTNM